MNHTQRFVYHGYFETESHHCKIMSDQQVLSQTLLPPPEIRRKLNQRAQEDR